MLAQNFMKPEALGISEEEFFAHLAVLGMLERGEIHDNHFRMAVWWNECGTVGCIGGWAEKVAKKPFGEFGCTFTQNPNKYELHMAEGHDWLTIRPRHAAIAIRNYLTTGEARWAEAIAE